MTVEGKGDMLLILPKMHWDKLYHETSMMLPLHCIVAALPVTICETESSISRMKHIKNELRRTMTDQRKVAVPIEYVCVNLAYM